MKGFIWLLAGLIIGEKDVSSDSERVASLAQFPPQTDDTGVRSFLGLANQLSSFVLDLHGVTQGADWKRQGLHVAE